MKKSLRILLILVSLSFGLHAQTFWKQYSPQYILPSSSVVTPDNGLMIAGLSADSGFILAHILRIDSAGSIIFSLQNYLTPDSMGATFFKIIKTRDGNFLGMGAFDDWPSQFGFYLHKFDINGNTIWDRFIYNNNCNVLQLEDSKSIIETSDGGFAMSGSVDFHHWTAMFILKTDSTGFPEWYKVYDIGIELQRWSNNLCEKSDSGFVAFEQINEASITQDAILISTDKNGNVLSGFTLDSTNSSRLQAIYKVHGDIYLSFGDGFVKTKLDTNVFSFNSYDDLTHHIEIESIDESLSSDLLLTYTGYDSIPENWGGMRIDSSGNIIWAHTFSAVNSPESLHELPDRSYLLDGIGYDSTTWFIEVIKLDTTGNINCYQDSVGISAHSVTEKLSPFPVNVDSCQLSTLPLNMFWHNVGTTTNICISTGVNEAVENSTFIFPNPTSGILYIKGKNKLKEISIYDVLGNLIINKRINDDLNSLDLSFLSQGIYLCRIISADNEEFIKLILN